MRKNRNFALIMLSFALFLGSYGIFHKYSAQEYDRSPAAKTTSSRTKKCTREAQKVLLGAHSSLSRFRVDELLRLTSKEVTAGPPLASDYKATLRNDGYVIIGDLPQVEQEDITWLRKQVLGSSSFGVTKITYSEGSWFINDIRIQGSLADRMTAVRRGLIAFLPVEVKAKAKKHYFQIEVRVDYPTEQLGGFSKSPYEFHIDESNSSPYGVLDTIQGEGTYVRGSAGNIFQVGQSEAVITSDRTSKLGTVHAVPENDNPPRIFMRYDYGYL